jgi:protocatechuate 3,4-dioxygenase beta subunit
MRKELLSCILVILILPCLLETASACTCANQSSPCAAFGATPVVFVGHVVSIKEDKAEINRFGVKEVIRTGLVAHMVVEEALKGITQKEVDVVTGGGGGDCGYRFIDGERYLVYAYPNRRGDGEDANRLSSTHLGGSGVKITPDSITTSICTRTSLLKHAQDDLGLIRALLNKKPETRIFGGVGEYIRPMCKRGSCFPNHAGPLAGVTIRAQSPQGNHETKTDENGAFRFVNLSPGKYKVRLVMPEYYEMQYHFARGEIEVTVESGCSGVELDFGVQTSGRITGAVIDADGKPVGRNVQVSIIAADDADKPISTLIHRSEYTDELGRYKFDGVPPGRYILGIGIAAAPTKHTPYSKIYYPKGNFPSQTNIIEIAKGQKLNELNLRLEPRLKAATITGVVVDENGKPVAGVDVDLYDFEDPDYPLFGVDVKTDPEGRFTMDCFEGRRYLVHAWKPQDYFAGTGKQSAPAEVDTSKPSQPVNMILNKSGVFRSQLEKQ